MTDLIDLLSQARVFLGLPEPIRRALAACARRRHLVDGEVLFREGEAADCLFVVERGQVEVRKAGPAGKDIGLRRMVCGEVGGLTSMAVDKTRSATVVAHGEADVVLLDRPAFQALMDAHPELARAVMAALSAKVRTKTYQLARLLEQQVSTTGVRIAFFDAKPYEVAAFDRVQTAGWTFEYVEARLGPTTARLATGCPVVCAFVNDDLGADVLEVLAACGVELIALRCAGYNHVDLGAAARLGLEVVRVPAYSPHAVAEHALALLLTLNRKTHRAYNRVREGNFSLKGLVGVDLHGRVAGIVGLGRIGRCLAEALRGLGMQVLVYDVAQDEAFAARTGVTFVGLDRLIRVSDVISLHAPLTPDTFHLIDAARIAAMKRGVFLLNTSRGGLVDTAALIEGLKSGQVGAAGLDVYEEESAYFFEDRSDRAIADDHLARLMTFPNVLVTSHQAFLTEEALENIAQTTCGNIYAFLEGARGAALDHAVRAAPGTA